MDTPNVSMPGYRINEYRLVIPFCEVLREKLQQVRQELFAKHRIPLPPEEPKDLTLLKFHAFEKTEGRLLERLQQVASGFTPFKVELDRFSAYPSHSIYINIPTRTPFLELVRELKKMKWMMNIQGYEPHFIPEPHLELAYKLKPMQFINLWMECEYASFSGRFTADALVLLRRGPEKKYEPVQRLALLSEPTFIKQGSLFG